MPPSPPSPSSALEVSHATRNDRENAVYLLFCIMRMLEPFTRWKMCIFNDNNSNNMYMLLPRYLYYYHYYYNYYNILQRFRTTMDGNLITRARYALYSSFKLYLKCRYIHIHTYKLLSSMAIVYIWVWSMYILLHYGYIYLHWISNRNGTFVSVNLKFCRWNPILYELILY